MFGGEKSLHKEMLIGGDSCAVQRNLLGIDGGLLLGQL